MPSGHDVLFFEDLEVGRQYRCGSTRVTAEDINRFAQEFDPQPFHLDEVAARDTIFGELVASGWQTSSLTMSLAVKGEMNLAGGWIGLSIDSIRWPIAVRPGDQLTAVTEVLEARPSKNKPQYGVIKVRTRTSNQREELVCEIVSNQLVLRRSSG